MNYTIVFSNPQYCSDKGKPLEWHNYGYYAGLGDAEKAADRLRSSVPGLSVRIYELCEIKPDIVPVIRIRRAG
jgi:hypothetical protein